MLQNLDSFVRELSVGAGTDVEQEVGIHACCCDKATDEFIAALVVLVRNAVAPGVVHRHAGLQGELRYFLFAIEAGCVLSGQVLLEELEVLDTNRCPMMVVADKAARLQFLDECVLFIQSPVEALLLVVPHTVEPDGANRPIVGEELCELLVHKGIVAVPVGGRLVVRAVTAVAHRIVGAVPVHVAVVEVELEPVLTTGIGERFENVASVRCGLDDVIGASLGLPHREAVMMPAGKGDVLCASILEVLNPFTGVEPGRTETASQFGVFVAVYVAVVHYPFSIGQHGIDAKMDEDAELAVLEVFTDAARLVADDKALCHRCKGKQKNRKRKTKALHDNNMKAPPFSGGGV